MNLLLLSNSSSDAGYLVHALPDIRELIATLPAGAPAVFCFPSACRYSR